MFDGADIFLGLSAPGVLKPEMLRKMAQKPLVLALANPTPEIMPELAKEVRPDAMVCTGRSDYSNQVNNVLCFPYIFRGALDVGATTINEEMKLAAVHAIARLAHEPGAGSVTLGQPAVYGPDHIIPNPFDQRLILRIAPPWRGPRWIPAWQSARSPISTPITTASTASSSAPAS